MKESQTKADFAESSTRHGCLKGWTPEKMRKDMVALGHVKEMMDCLEKHVADVLAVVNALQSNHSKQSTQTLMSSWQVDAARRVLKALFVPRNSVEEEAFMKLMSEDDPKIVEGPAEKPRLSCSSGGVLKCQEWLEVKVHAFQEEHGSLTGDKGLQDV